MPRRGENIRKRKDGRWEGRFIIGYQNNGKAIYKSVYGKTYKETKEKLENEKKNTNPKKESDKKQFEEKQEKKIIFSEAMEQWLAYKKFSLAPSSILKYERLIKKHICPELGTVYVQDVNTALILELLENKAKEQELSSSMLQSILYIVKAVCEYCVIEKKISEIKFSVKIHCKPKREVAVLNRQEQKKLEHSLLSIVDESRLGIMICLYTGIRLGEICALKWKDISLESSTIYVTKTIQRLSTKKGDKKTELILTKPKSICSIRTIPMPSVLSDIIRKFQEKVPCIENHYVLSNQENKPIEPRTYEYRFKKYLEQAGISYYKFHTLRHTFATNCVNAGVDIKSLSEILGHSNVSVTLQKYVHSSFEMKQQQIEKLCFIGGQNDGQDLEK